jgi:hypothetical protein
MSSFTNISPSLSPASTLSNAPVSGLKRPKPNPILQPLQTWLDGIEIQNAKLARVLCKAIPATCPFERDVVVLGRKLGHIPPMCKINPVYEQLMGLRFRALCYLVDVCGESV